MQTAFLNDFFPLFNDGNGSNEESFFTGFGGCVLDKGHHLDGFSKAHFVGKNTALGLFHGGSFSVKHPLYSYRLVLAIAHSIPEWLKMFRHCEVRCWKKGRSGCSIFSIYRSTCRWCRKIYRGRHLEVP